MILGREIRQFECYTDLSVAHQKDIDNFPMCFMFGRLSDEEIRDELYKSLGTRNLDDVMKSPYGGIILKKDLDALNELFEHHEKEREYFNKSFDKLVDAIKTEMYNHEYGYTQEPEETLMALGKTEADFSDERFRNAWAVASKKVLGKSA